MRTRSISLFRSWVIPALLLFGLLLGTAGCGSITSHVSASSDYSDPAACDAKKVSITGVHWFKDSTGAWRVVGLITNRNSKAIGKIVTGVETRTSTDSAADQGEDVADYMLNLPPGQQAPFTAWIDREIPGLDHFEVEVDNCVLAESAERSRVDVRGGQMLVDDAGMAQVTAELSNSTSKSVLVNGLIAAIYDPAGTLMAAQYANVTPRYLAPGESGPVRASVYLPAGAGPKASSYQFFMDVVVDQPAPLPLSATQDVQILSHYIDNNGHFHQLGQITNPTSTGVMTSLQAMTYSDASKSRVLDASQMTTWVPLMPGETLPFDLTDWGPLNQIKGSAGGQNIQLSLRLEPFLTWTTAASVRSLSISQGNVSFQNGQAVFTGKATNDGQSGITSGWVNAVLRDKSSNKTVAVGSTHLDITDSAAPGQVLAYSLNVSLPPGIDPASLVTEITARGYQP